MRGVLALLLSAVAYAGAKQGAACQADTDCGAPLACKKTSGAPHCELVCDDKTKCPSDQRCVKDHDLRVCRAIVDGVDL